MQKEIKVPNPCPECDEPRRLNVLVFLCGCVMRKHTYLAHQFPVYAAAPEMLAACKAALFAFEAMDGAMPNLRRRLQAVISKVEGGAK